VRRAEKNDELRPRTALVRHVSVCCRRHSVLSSFLDMTCVEFKIPRTAADALPIESVLPGARSTGVPNGHFEYSTVSAGVGSMRITCSVEMATYLVTCLTELATSLEGKDQAQLVIDCTYGVKAAFDAIEHEIYGPGGRPDPGIRTSLN
jgi:hypothetical protein